MPKFAQFDPVSRAVVGYLDTDRFDYDPLPPAEQLIELPDEQSEQPWPAWVVDGALRTDEPAAASAARAWASHQADAAVALKASDLVAIRCLKAGVPFPAPWQAYVGELRTIVRASSGEMAPLPVPPAYPAGT